MPSLHSPSQSSSSPPTAYQHQHDMTAASDLASDFVQECLGFASLRSKLHALRQIQSSLQSCFDFDDVDDDENKNDDGARRRQEWNYFLGGGQYYDDDGFGGDNENNSESESDFMLRDSLIKCLTESCHRGDENNGGSRRKQQQRQQQQQQQHDDDDDDEKIIESSFLSLSYLVRLRCSGGDKKKLALLSGGEPIFGPDFIMTIAADIVEALASLSSDEDYGTTTTTTLVLSTNNGDGNCDTTTSTSSSGVPNAACQLLIALLRSDRPRNESCIDTIRDTILLPASDTTTPTTTSNNNNNNNNAAPVISVARIAKVLSASIIAAVDHAVPASKKMDEVELSMRRETAALNFLQDVRDVMMNVGNVCWRGLLNSRDDGNGNGNDIINNNGGTAEDSDSDYHLGRCSERILSAIQEIYDFAAFAVESQLETLLDEKATLILSRLSSKESSTTNQGVENKMDGVGANDGYGSEMTEDCDGIMEDGKELLKVEQTLLALPPLYANMAKPPFILTSLKNLESQLVDITESLKLTDSELWDERLSALVDLERILAGGVASMSHEAQHLFVEKLRKMPLQEQFADLRSQITQQVCKVMVATAYEYRDFVAEDVPLNQSVCHLIDCNYPAMLNLCKSGTRLMATQGMNCLLHLVTVCGPMGYPRTVSKFCDEISGKKVHKNRKRGSVMALTAALRAWDSNCFARHVDQLAVAVKEATGDRDPAVREESRKLYWAMMSCCEETSRAVDSMFDDRSREMKNLLKERDGIDAEWEEKGAMSTLMRTGVLGKAPKKTPAKKGGGANKSNKSRLPAPKGVPPRSSAKRPASSRLRAEHGTPFKSHRGGTPMKAAGGASTSSSSSSKIRPPSSAGSSRAQISTPSVKTGIAASPMRFSQKKSSVNGSGHGVSSSKTSRVRPSPALIKSEVVVPSSPVEGKENTVVVAMRTPTKSVGFNVNMGPATPVMMGTPVVNLLARASPLSAERVRTTGDILGGITLMLSDSFSPHEQSLGIKALSLFAKESPNHQSWEKKFPLVLDCLLDNIRNMPTARFDGPVDFIRSPSKNLSSCHQMQHLFLQCVRSLLQFVPEYVKSDQIKDIICCVLECTKDAPFEIVHTAERALDNLVTGTDHQICFEHLLPFTCIDIDLNDKNNPPMLLSTLRTMKHLVDKISSDSLDEALPSLLPLFHTTLCHKSVDMRKATVFILVEMHFVLGDELGLDDFTDCQRRLLDVYIERHPKKSQMVTETLPQPNGMMPVHPIVA